MVPPDENEDFEALLAEYEQKAPQRGRDPRVGDTVSGPVISVTDEAVFIDLGGKSEGMLERNQVCDEDGKLLVSVGDELEARVVDEGKKSGVVMLRRTIAKGAEAHAELAQAHEHRIPVEGLVTAVNKGGFEVQVAGVRAFCPVSQIDNRFVEDPNQFVGAKFTFRVTQFEGGRRPNIVLSRRALLEEEAAEKARELRATLAAGQTVRGTVSSLKPYGAFIDLGGLEGMLHVSELGFSRVSDPAEVLAVGQEVEVQILKIEQSDNPKRPEKISLSMKSLLSDPWQAVQPQLVPGTRIRGTVTRTESYGAFVEVAPGVEGLVHISQLSEARVRHPRDVVSVGQSVETEVLDFDLAKRRLSLSIRSLVSADRDAEERKNIAEHSPRGGNLGTLGDLLKDRLGK